MNSDAPPPVGNWNYPTKVRIGAGRIAELARVCRSLGMSRPLLVTDAGLAAHPMVKRVLERNAADGLPTGLYAEVKPNPTGSNVLGGVAAYRAGGHDGIIAFGGGSGLDAAKAVALMVGQDGDIWDYEDVGDNWKRVKPERMAPVVAVPTTAGTGSETGRAAVIVDERSHAKRILFHPAMLPAAVIADPELTVGLPPNLTAWTGIDAFTHCFEAFCAPGYHPMADGIALEGMRLVKEWLPVAFREGTNLTARTHMMAAAAMGSTAFQKGLGGVHALSHAVGATYDTQHGLTNAVFLPYVMAFNKPAIAGRMEHLARVLGLKRATFRAVLDWVLGLRDSLGIPHAAGALGIEEAKLGPLAKLAAADSAAPGNPLPLTAKETRRILKKALAGKI
jgi:alcohol dehydrogenase class IV